MRDFDEAFFGGGGPADRSSSEVRRRAEAGQVEQFADRRIGAPIARPHQIVCIGLNYSDHAAETGATVPPEPIIFSKSPNTLVGPYDEIRIPRTSTKTDWEVELGVVIGSRARYLPDAEAARAAIAGFVVRQRRQRAGVPDRAQRPMDEGQVRRDLQPVRPLAGHAGRDRRRAVVGHVARRQRQRRQTGSTSTMVFDPYFVVAYLSQFMVLEPGDLINTGTPPGVGMGMTPPTYLRAGDVVELGIDGPRRTAPARHRRPLTCAPSS